MNPSKSTERFIIADITALLPGLSEDGTRRVQAELNIALAGRRLPKITQPAGEMLCDYPERRISVAWSQNCAPRSPKPCFTLMACRAYI
jgi:hypothetical protein